MLRFGSADQQKTTPAAGETPMHRDVQIKIAKRLLGHIQNGTAESAPEQRRIPVSDYIDPDLWAREVELLYRNAPIVAGMSCELPGPASYKALDLVGRPVLLVRDGDGRLGAFLNVCRHRGSPVVAEGCGEARRFSCPYHGWTYDQAGRLIGVSEEATFGAVNRDSHGLTPLPAAERAGVIFVGLTPGMAFDIDTWLAGVDHHLAESEPERLTLAGTRTVPAPNWKIAMEGHLESYHFAALHRNSIADFAVSNCATIDRFGPHVLITFANKVILKLLEMPEAEWHPIRDQMITPQFVLFPGATITLTGKGLLTQIIHPGAEVGLSTNRLVVGYDAADNDPATVAGQIAFLDSVAALVNDEDYAGGFGVQRGMHSGAQSEIILGRNEPGPIRLHEELCKALGR
jgi:nitrite reductase/ring-hydroxylating ferredoxin subunit